jgi:hypothetical protein
MRPVVLLPSFCLEEPVSWALISPGLTFRSLVEGSPGPIASPPSIRLYRYNTYDGQVNLTVLNVEVCTVKRAKFGNGSFLRHLFSDDIFPGIKVVDTISKSKRLLLISSNTVEFCGEELKCHLLICIIFVYLTKQC